MDYNKIKYVNCRLCDSDDFEIIADEVQFNFPYKTVICKDCGFIYINPEPLEEELNNYYVNEYEKYYGVPVKFGDPSFKLRGYEIYDFLKQDVNKANSILEIGAGGGGNLVGLSEKFNTAHMAAFEPGGASNDSLKNIGIEVIGEFYDQESVNLQEYELIVLSHVLEHFYNPKKVLAKLWNETSDSVYVYIAIPSLCAIDKESFHYYYNFKLEDHWLRIVHLSYFHLYNIEDMLVLTGWKIKKIYNKGNGELLLLVMKNKQNKERFVIRSAYEEHLEEIKFYRLMSNHLNKQ